MRVKGEGKGTRVKGENQPPTTNYSLPVTNRQLPIASVQLPIASVQLPIASVQLPIANIHASCQIEAEKWVSITQGITIPSSTEAQA